MQKTSASIIRSIIHQTGRMVLISNGTPSSIIIQKEKEEEKNANGKEEKAGEGAIDKRDKFTSTFDFLFYLSICLERRYNLHFTTETA